MKDMLNFRALAKNVITLRKHENIAEILGVALEDVPHFIYQKHIECGTLKDVLLRNYQHFSDSSKVATAQLAEHEKTLQLTVYAVDVCNGMFFLASQKFLHPGLAARKVLLSSSGKCKLYDFWPVDLAQERMDSILESKFPPLAWLAPETVFLGHYKEKSDVWNFGVVAWEIYSLGDTPFGGLTCPEIEKKLRAKDNLDQPLACPGGLFGVLLSTWNSSIEERPSFGSLRNTFMTFLKNMKQASGCSDDGEDPEEPNYFVLASEDGDNNDYIDVSNVGNNAKSYQTDQ